MGASNSNLEPPNEIPITTTYLNEENPNYANDQGVDGIQSSKIDQDNTDYLPPKKKLRLSTSLTECESQEAKVAQNSKNCSNTDLTEASPWIKLIEGLEQDSKSNQWADEIQKIMKGRDASDSDSSHRKPTNLSEISKQIAKNISENLEETLTRNKILSLGLTRIKRDIVYFYKDPPLGIYIAPDEADIKTIYALVIGPEGTIYEGGFFYYKLQFPENYPLNPPKVQFLTTGQGRVWFNPSLYSSGTVCLSILNEADIQTWSPTLSLTSILTAVRSIMNEKPLNNMQWSPKDEYEITLKNYNDCITHETIRVAVCEMLEDKTKDIHNVPETLKEEMKEAFLRYYEHYKNIVDKNAHLTRQHMKDPLGYNKGSFDYPSLKKRLEALKVQYSKEVVSK